MSIDKNGRKRTPGSIEATLYRVLAESKGGQNRVRILQALRDRPRNANQLAEELRLDYKTVRYHLGVLQNEHLVTDTGDDYGAVYFPADRVRHNWNIVEAIASRRDSP